MINENWKSFSNWDTFKVYGNFQGPNWHQTIPPIATKPTINIFQFAYPHWASKSQQPNFPKYQQLDNPLLQQTNLVSFQGPAFSSQLEGVLNTKDEGKKI